MLKIDKLLEYAIENAVKVKEYDYTDPNRIIISENNKPMFVIERYEFDENPGFSKVVYRKYIHGMVSMSKANSGIILVKYIEESENTTTINTYDESNDLIEIEKIVNTDKYIMNISQRPMEDHYIMRIIRANEEIIRDRSSTHLVNEYIRDMGNGNRVTVYVQQHIFNEESTFQYIKIEYVEGEPVLVVQKLYDSKFKRIACQRVDNKEEISKIPWIERNHKVIESEEKLSDDIISILYIDTLTEFKNIVYYNGNGEPILDILVDDEQEIINFSIKYDNREYFAKRYIDTSSAMYEVSYYRYNKDDDIDQSVSMLVNGDNIKDLLDEIIEDMFGLRLFEIKYE